jgi:hypothetical protein
MLKKTTKFYMLGKDLVRLDTSQRYNSGNTTVYEFVCRNGERFLTLSVNIPELNILLGPQEFFVKVWSENEPYISKILALGLFEDTGKMVSTGFCFSPVWKRL